ncbi:D-glycero-beta-D-manno-heptose 1,7-bisphosphate 7-phosphatase [Candidatus Pseudothioglobus sp. Uisw_016]|jgi:D-glycero-D-manno-heptose 1,7-bisphosphate phosphatase|uniref:D-glycero-beta-D-manno-heptose 1,7-bisphosphate 7-phosphatase n=1 Tax=Candidatus Pseudothioglobus sp. Uisw_016 TaxID=3230995 RepID=UPI003A8AA3E9
MSKKAIFLDRDGVINKEVNYLYKIENFEFINGIFESCLYFQNLGYIIIIITNQSGISREFYSDNDYQKLSAWMLEEFSKHGIIIQDTFYCPHGPESNCRCRKPKPGMFIEAKKKHNINMKESWMIGDSEIDIQSANGADIQNTILVRSGKKIIGPTSNAKFILDSIRDAPNFILD